MSIMSKPLIILISLSLISGCGSKSTVSNAQQSTQVTAVESSAETITKDLNAEKQAAGQKYLEIVNAVNCATKKRTELENANINDDGTVDIAAFDETIKLYGEIASYRQVAYRSLLNYEWPENVQAEIRNLASEWAKWAQEEQAISETVNIATFNTLVNDLIKKSNSSIANPGLVRGLLGLDSASVTDNC
jgi:hypothetical protein